MRLQCNKAYEDKAETTWHSQRNLVSAIGRPSRKDASRVQKRYTRLEGCRHRLQRCAAVHACVSRCLLSRALQFGAQSQLGTLHVYVHEGVDGGVQSNRAAAPALHQVRTSQSVGRFALERYHQWVHADLAKTAQAAPSMPDDVRRLLYYVRHTNLSKSPNKAQVELDSCRHVRGATAKGRVRSGQDAELQRHGDVLGLRCRQGQVSEHHHQGPASPNRVDPEDPSRVSRSHRLHGHQPRLRAQ